VRRVLILFAALVACCTALAQGPAAEGSVTVRLFSLHAVREVTFTPLGANSAISLCPRCDQKKIDAPTTVKWANGRLNLAGDAIALRSLEFRGAFRVQVAGTPESETAAGSWIVDAVRTGLRVILTTSTERYVLAVLNGEAAPNEPLQSLKAMAVVARTFALTNAHRHANEGFGLCDSTHCQALRFGSVRSTVHEAVRATTGEALWTGTSRAQAFATQHCGGEAEDASSVWPGLHAPYLHAHPDPYCLRRSSALWHADVSITEFTRILREQRWSLPEPIETIHVTKRTPTGRAQMVEVVGQGRRAQISASSLHFAFDRALGWNQLRSDWYEITVNNSTVHFEGKGYGHGVGLCQTGSFEMATEGRDYREILNFYFSGTQVRIFSDDDGWKQTPGAGWTLATTGSPESLLIAGNVAWAKAQSLFHPTADVHPEVQLMPSTELFRQATDEPGWMLAATHGTNIVLQPLPVLRAHGGESSTLLHEFLHVLVEQEATSQTPLWLREGFVEFLSGDNQRRSDAMPPSEIENALAHPSNLAESQRAHAAATQLVKNLIDKYGLQTVRTWLRSGVPPTVLS